MSFDLQAMRREAQKNLSLARLGFSTPAAPSLNTAAAVCFALSATASRPHSTTAIWHPRAASTPPPHPAFASRASSRSLATPYARPAPFRPGALMLAQVVSSASAASLFVVDNVHGVRLSTEAQIFRPTVLPGGMAAHTLLQLGLGFRYNAGPCLHPQVGRVHRDFQAEMESGLQLRAAPSLTKTKKELGETVGISELGVDHLACPVAWLKRHVAAGNIVGLAEGLCTRARSKGQRFVLTKDVWIQQTNELLALCGLPPLQGHSVCIGGATQLLMNGVPPEVVKVQGRWASNACQVYWRYVTVILTFAPILSTLDESLPFSIPLPPSRPPTPDPNKTSVLISDSINSTAPHDFSSDEDDTMPSGHEEDRLSALGPVNAGNWKEWREAFQGCLEMLGFDKAMEEAKPEEPAGASRYSTEMVNFRRALKDWTKDTASTVDLLRRHSGSVNTVYLTKDDTPKVWLANLKRVYDVENVMDGAFLVEAFFASKFTGGSLTEWLSRFAELAEKVNICYKASVPANNKRTIFDRMLRDAIIIRIGDDWRKELGDVKTTATTADVVGVLRRKYDFSVTSGKRDEDHALLVSSAIEAADLALVVTPTPPAATKPDSGRNNN
ncbi:hypothetical protein P7C70_g5792, partial [Phenoliferia sp. Uapishka_3]